MLRDAAWVTNGSSLTIIEHLVSRPPPDSALGEATLTMLFAAKHQRQVESFHHVRGDDRKQRLDLMPSIPSGRAVLPHRQRVQ